MGAARAVEAHAVPAGPIAILLRRFVLIDPREETAVRAYKRVSSEAGQAITAFEIFAQKSMVGDGSQPAQSARRFDQTFGPTCWELVSENVGGCGWIIIDGSLDN